MTKIKDILKIIISIIIIFLAIKSCSHAFTLEEFREFLQNTEEQQTNTTLKSYGTTFLNNYNSFITYLQNQNININNYPNIIIISNGSAYTGTDVILIENTETFTYDIRSNERIHVTKATYIEIYYDTSNPQQWRTRNNKTNTSIELNVPWGLLDKEPIDNNYRNAILQNYLNYFDLLGAENRDINLLPWYFANARISNINNNNENSFQLYDTNNKFIKYLNAKNMTQVNGGYLYQLEIPNTNNIKNGDYYKVRYNDNQTNFFTSQEFKISWERDTSNEADIINESGDKQGSIDLSKTNEKLEEINTSINNQGQNIIKALESGEQKAEERQNYWQQAYDKLFTISGDYVENKLQEIRNELNISGDYEEEKAFINLINENASDFIISWESYTPHFSIQGQQIDNVQMISGDKINFSKLERENEGLHEAMTWTRTLLGFSLGILLIKNGWKTLMHTLGIGVQVYENSKEEQGTITQNITIDKKGNTTTTETYKKGNITIRRKK